MEASRITADSSASSSRSHCGCAISAAALAVPLRHGVHWPQDSCSKKRMVLRAACTALSCSDSTTTAQRNWLGRSEGAELDFPLAVAVRVPAFWGLVVAFAGYGLAFSAMSFHLIPLLAERKIEMGVVMAIIALIGPMQVVGRVLLMVGQRHITTIQLGAGIYFAFPISMAMLALGISDVYGLILFAIIYGVANGLITILRGMAVPEFIGPEGYGVVSGALTMPTNIMRAAGPLLASLAWGAFGGYTPVLWGLAVIMLVAALGFAAAAFLSFSSDARGSLNSQLSSLNSQFS